MPDAEHDNVRAMWSEDELDQALAALRPGGEPDSRAFLRARAELLVGAGAPAPEPGPEPVRQRRWAWWAAAIGTVTAVAASVLVVQTVQIGGPTSDAAAVEQLNLAADRVDVVDEPVGPGEYRYIGTHAWWMASMDRYSYLAENLIETWQPADWTQEWLERREVTGARKWVSGTEEQARADGFPIDEPGWPEGEQRATCGNFNGGRGSCTRGGGWQQPTPEFFAGLPTDTDELYDRLRKDTEGRGSDPDQEVLVYVADVLRTGLVPAELRAALYRVLARVPGIQITEQVANLDGRRGTAYGISAAGTRHDVIVDPATGQFIGERQVTEQGFDGIPAGTVTGYTSVTVAVVPTIGVPPTG